MKTCEWVPWGEDCSVYDTECGGAFTVTEGTPTENDFNFCPYCGGKLVEADDETEDDD